MTNKLTEHTLTVKGQDASQKSPSDREWRELYEAALKFKQLECWNWLWDTDIFGGARAKCRMGKGAATVPIP